MGIGLCGELVDIMRAYWFYTRLVVIIKVTGRDLDLWQSTKHNTVPQARSVIHMDEV